MHLAFVTTEPTWEDAAALYRSCGFQLVARSTEMLRFELRMESSHDPTPRAIGAAVRASAPSSPSRS